MTFDFAEYAQRLAEESGNAHMAPVIEKEILHYEILNALDQLGLLNLLTFQGGTCLRLCYRSVRYSEDLAFAAGDAYDSIDLEHMAAHLSRSLERKFGVMARAKAPKKDRAFTHVGVRRWWMVVDTAPARPDLASQRIKIEIASVPSHTRDVRPLELHYPSLPQSYAQVLAVCQSSTEILADKLISFADAKKYVRYRDLWDIPWLMRQPGVDTSQLSRLVALKHADYYCETPLEIMMAEGAERGSQLVNTDQFAAEMRRFIPHEHFARTVGRAEYRQVMVELLQQAYQLAAPARL